MGYSPPSSSVKFDANGNVLANVNAQNITPNVNTVNAPNVNAINNPPLRNEFMTRQIISTTSTTDVTLATYVSSNGIGLIYANITNSNGSYATYLSFYNASTELGGTQVTPNVGMSYVSHLFAYPPQGSATISIEGYVSGTTGYYDISIYEVF